MSKQKLKTKLLKAISRSDLNKIYKNKKLLTFEILQHIKKF